MEFLDIARYLGALFVVLALIGGAALAARKFGVPGVTKGISDKRLTVVETLMLGPRQRLFILRRDSVEHLVMTAPEGISVIESGFSSPRSLKQDGFFAGDMRAAAEPIPVKLLKFLLPFLLLITLIMPQTASAAALKLAPANASPAVATGSASPTGNGGLSIDFSGSGLFTDRMVQIVALITVLSIAPSILIMMTSFVRIVVVLSLLRTALGLQQSPPNSVIVSLAMFLTLFVMSPTLTAAYHQGIEPMMNNSVTAEQGFTQALVPMKKFMLAHVRDADLKLFMDMAHEKAGKPEDMSTTTLAPAFMLSELKRAFEIGFLIFVPFLIIDMAVASILMSMGMMMLPPVIISLPFKLIFFVLVDGWRLISGSLVQSYLHSPPPS